MLFHNDRLLFLFYYSCIFAPFFKWISIRCQRSGQNHCNYQQVKCYRLCVWPPHPFHTQRGKIPIFHLSIWSLPQDRRFPTPPPPPMPAGQRARSDLPAACYERLWVSSSDYCLGGFILYLHLSHSQIKLLFLLPSLYLHLSLCLPPPSLFLECFLFPWSLVSDSLCLLCGFIYPECSSCTAWRRNTKPTLGDAFLLLSSSFLFLITLSILQSLVILWFYDFVNHSTPCFSLMSLRLNFNSFFRIIFAHFVDSFVPEALKALSCFETLSLSLVILSVRLYEDAGLQ